MMNYGGLGLAIWLVALVDALFGVLFWWTLWRR